MRRMVDEAFAKFPAAFPCAMPAPPALAEPTTPGYGGPPGAPTFPPAGPCVMLTQHTMGLSGLNHFLISFNVGHHVFIIQLAYLSVPAFGGTAWVK